MKHQNRVFGWTLFRIYHSIMDTSKLIKKFQLPSPVYVTQPTLPDLKDFHAILEKIWESKTLTNSGEYHNVFEEKLNVFLGSKNCNLFCNGTIALLVSLKALDVLEGEVITTPFTFPATVHVLSWGNLTPVFCDIEEKMYNIDPEKIEKLITPKTKAILPVHVFGSPCDVEKIQKIAQKHHLKVIYDAAHAFGVKYKDRPIVDWGDISMLSFHATKHFHTIEGGALISGSSDLKRKIDLLKNFGIADEETVLFSGINGKLNELQAAYGILQLDMIKTEIGKRKKLTELYREKLKGVPGIVYLEDMPFVKHNYSNFPILVDENAYGMDRSSLYGELKKINIFARKYFFPLASNYSCYSHLPSAAKGSLPNAEKIAENILCLPLYGSLQEKVVETICNVIMELRG